MLTKKLLPHDEYLRSLPKKRMGICVLFFDEAGRLLIVKPNYKEGWSVPGGVIDADESPKRAGIREIKEEIGLAIPDLKFLFVEYNAPRVETNEGLEFIFSGGILDKEQVAKIVIQEDEFDDWQFSEIDEALKLLRESIRRRVAASLEIIKNGIPKYSEFGK